MDVRDLEPKECFRHFAELAKIPRGSGHEKAVSDYLLRFAEERGFAAVQDEQNNICIKKPASPGCEEAKPVILQGHMDMVQVKSEGLSFDFASDPLRLLTDGESVRADGTTLGADNGIALAYMLALLEAENIPHPPLEMVITTEEETGMAGAKHFDAACLSGSSFINLDSEQDGVFCASCAGGRRSRVILPLKRTALVSLPDHADHVFFTVSVSGLAGGHSGIEIHKQRGNANRLLGRCLDALMRAYGLHLVHVDGGLASNVIPTAATATICTGADRAAVQGELDRLLGLFRHELRAADGADLRLDLSEAARADAVFSEETTRKALTVMLLMPHGVMSMDLNMTGQSLPESSNNFAVVATEEEGLTFSCLSRSSLGSLKELICGQIGALAASVGARAEFFGDYPAWEYDPDSQLRRVFLQAHASLFGREAVVEGIHAGLECGIFAEKFKALGRTADYIAIGPTITGAHSTEETLSRSSTERVWKLLLEGLKQLGNSK